MNPMWTVVHFGYLYFHSMVLLVTSVYYYSIWIRITWIIGTSVFFVLASYIFFSFSSYEPLHLDHSCCSHAQEFGTTLMPESPLSDTLTGKSPGPNRCSALLNEVVCGSVSAHWLHSCWALVDDGSQPDGAQLLFLHTCFGKPNI